jgi:hypothetical protein
MPKRGLGRFHHLESGAEEDRTLNLLNAIQALSQLSYCPNGLAE